VHKFNFPSGMKLIAAYSGRIYPFDLIGFAPIKRTLALIAGFAMLIRTFASGFSIKNRDRARAP
jgi:hypothetical protein